MTRNQKATAETAPLRVASETATSVTQTTDITAQKPADDLAKETVDNEADAKLPQAEPNESRPDETLGSSAAIATNSADQKSVNTTSASQQQTGNDLGNPKMEAGDVAPGDRLPKSQPELKLADPSVVDADSAGQEPENKMGDSQPQSVDEKAQPAPSLDDLTRSAVEAQQVALKSDCYVTVLYFRGGLVLIELKAQLRKLGRRDFCEHTEAAGIKPWYRKRAMQIASHFKTEEACGGLPVLDALRAARKTPGTTTPKAPTKPTADAVSDSRPAATPLSTATAPTTGNTVTGTSNDDTAHTDGHTSDTPRVPRWRRAKKDDCAELTACEIDAGTKLLEAVEGDRQRAVHIVEVLTQLPQRLT